MSFQLVDRKTSFKKIKSHRFQGELKQQGLTNHKKYDLYIVFGYFVSTQVPVRVEISRIIESLSAAQLFYILGHMQRLVLASPEVARSILRGRSVHYVHAIFNSMT